MTCVRHASLILTALPFGLIGGILSLFLSGQYRSVPASGGFTSLFGVAVMNGMVPMTALVAILGLAPMLFAAGPGSEVQKPLAAVMIGGLITSTLMTLLVLPVLYKRFESRLRIGTSH